ncbi:hydrogen gas-evolving membrane-bound hydrogenase subunit E [Salinilacihabitans rarus]|uniref:hydrogen gas-evolving membrane-bound hydrogenase subunit E n=1 Tax=Salinilacihabitans rarus TaxID=2961596 RepID=UPI0020C861F0|nr:hydrogen gas-evolving membrane-bound hydrogenase subunit E [Salinilacihabitans rarus]
MSPESAVVFVAVALPFAAAAATPVFFRALGTRTGYAGAVVALSCFGLLTTQHGAEGVVSIPWIPSLDVALRFYVDGWALLFALLASGIGVLVFVYSAAYLHEEEGLVRYYATLSAFMGSILGVALAADLIAIFLFWELTSLCSFVLIGYHTDDPTSQYAARMSMFVTVGGGLFLLVGFLLLAFVAGGVVDGSAFDLAAMLAESDAVRAALREAGLFEVVLLLIGVGAATKSAQVPLHFWLPNAMAAPTPVSAFLHSATMVKVGVYVVGRLRPLLLGEEWMLLFATLGLVTMTVGAVLAVGATDVKELLAYSTASHLGLMIAGFGFTEAVGAEAGAFHLFNHALFKAALFLVAGIVAYEAETRRIADIGGLGRALPITAAVTAVTALSMAGIPPFSGFYSKELLFEATVEAAHELGAVGWLYPAAATFASVFTVLYSLRFLALFFGPPRTDLEYVHRPAVAMLLPPAILAALTLVVSVAPGVAVDAIVAAAADATAVEAHAIHVGLPTEFSPAVGMSAVAIGGGVLAFPFYGRIHRGVRAIPEAVPQVSANWWYDALVVDGLRDAGTTLDARVHNGLLRTYATWTLAGTCTLALAGYLATRAVPVTLGLEAPPAIALVLLVAVVGAVAVARAPSHVAGVLTLSILGFMIAIFYILASAPDLALTQLVVETLVLLIFLLVIEEIPEYYEVDLDHFGRDAALSLLVGATAFLTVLLTTDARPPGPSELASYYTENAVPKGGGTNIVNVILVDFRGFDTLGEVTVVSMAAVSVITLIVMRSRGESG